MRFAGQIFQLEFGGGNANFQLLATLSPDEMGILGTRPALGTFDIPDARVVMQRDRKVWFWETCVQTISQHCFRAIDCLFRRLSNQNQRAAPLIF